MSQLMLQPLIRFSEDLRLSKLAIALGCSERTIRCLPRGTICGNKVSVSASGSLPPALILLA